MSMFQVLLGSSLDVQIAIPIKQQSSTEVAVSNSVTLPNMNKSDSSARVTSVEKKWHKFGIYYARQTY